MDIDSFLRDPLSRRRFFQTSGIGFASGSAVFLAACGDDDKAGSADGDADRDLADVEILNGALDLELMVVAAYKEGAALLRGGVLQIAKDLLEHEQEHADALVSAIKDAGGRPNRTKSSYDFPAWRSQSDVLTSAVELENTAVAAYIDALPKLTESDLRGTVAAILTSEAEHIALLRGALDLPPVPSAFVTGEVR
ncbi:MAG: ferritin-like domain-containing protein [Actinomycetota bacterium]|nr:ferritin-like domain-containing protein [Actinomycetota bacterium]